MSAPAPAPSRLMQSLALANAAPDLRDAIDALLPLARHERDALQRQVLIGDDISIGQRLLNHGLTRKAGIWNDAIGAAEKALLKAGA